MKGSRLLTLAFAALLADPHLVLAQNTTEPPAGALRSAQAAWGADPAKRCPELRQSAAEEGATSVVQFMVGSTGVPSRVSVRSSSGSEGFDAAAVSCVKKLRFLPVTRMGDGVAIESWQQLAVKSEGSVAAPQSARCEPAASSGVAAAGQKGSTVGDKPGPAPTTAGVCVCVDETGKITQNPVLMSSSGVSSFDKAALELSSATHYRPATAANGQPSPGCFRFKVGIEAK
jgi:TonB family protein